MAEINEAELNAWHEKHKELSIIAGYPPFTISKKKREELEEDMRNYTVKCQLSKDYSRPFSTLITKWDDDLEEARLYQKRYNSPYKAQQEALRINNMEPDPYNVDILALYPDGK